MGKFVIKTTASGVRFNLKAGNGQVIATSQTYKSLATCKKGIASVQKNAGAPVENQTVENYETVKNPKYERTGYRLQRRLHHAVQMLKRRNVCSQECSGRRGRRGIRHPNHAHFHRRPVTAAGIFEKAAGSDLQSIDQKIDAHSFDYI